MKPMPPDRWLATTLAGIEVWERTWRFDDWSRALAFVNALSPLAEAQDHHPLVELTWGRVTLRVWSHDVGGLTRRDERLCRAINAWCDAPAADPAARVP